MPGTVLAVDDDSAVLRFIGTVLEPAGYQVLFAEGGWNAIQAFGRADPPVSLLLTDVIMPDLTGPVLAAKLRALDPRLPVLFISGFRDTEMVRRLLTDEAYSLLSKPFTAEGLLRAVGDCLARR